MPKIKIHVATMPHVLPVRGIILKRGLMMYHQGYNQRWWENQSNKNGEEE